MRAISLLKISAKNQALYMKGLSQLQKNYFINVIYAAKSPLLAK
jgi:hypothetical protein